MDTLKVLLANGSPHKDGCVSTALSEIADTLKSEGIDSTPFWVGNQPVAGCIGCGVQRRPLCRQTCRSDSYLSPQRCDRGTRPDEQIHDGLQYAHRTVAALECSTREYTGGDSPGYGGAANHAHPCAEHGMAAEMYRAGS